MPDSFEWLAKAAGADVCTFFAKRGGPLQIENLEHWPRVTRTLVLAGMVALLSAMPTAQAADIVRLPVPNQTIYPGQTIRPDMLGWRRLRATRNQLAGLATKTTHLVDRVAKHTLIAGRAVHVSSLRAPFAVNKGQVTTIFFRGDGIEIQGRGVALKDAAAGEFVQVRNVETGRLVSGVAGRDGRVRVGGGQ